MIRPLISLGEVSACSQGGMAPPNACIEPEVVPAVFTKKHLAGWDQSLSSCRCSFNLGDGASQFSLLCLSFSICEAGTLIAVVCLPRSCNAELTGVCHTKN